MMGIPTVSVIIPTYNTAPLTGAAVRSVLVQIFGVLPAARPQKFA